MEAAAGKLQPDGTAYLNGQTVVQHLFSQAIADNIGVIRAFGHGATGNFVLQPSPGDSMPLILDWGATRCCTTKLGPSPPISLQVNTTRQPSKL